MAENEKTVVKNDKADKPEKKKEKKTGRIKEAWRGFKSELKKIVWPSGKQTFKNLLVVLVIIVVCAIIIAALDYAFANGMTNAASVTTDDGARYEIYYVETSGGDMTSVPIPDGAIFFNISGDNMNGFIVTVALSTPAN